MEKLLTRCRSIKDNILRDSTSFHFDFNSENIIKSSYLSHQCTVALGKNCVIGAMLIEEF